MIGARPANGRAWLPALVLALGCASQADKPAPAEQAAQVEHGEHCAQHESPEAAAPLPGRSIYHLQAKLRDHRGAELGLDAFRGQPVLIAMFYSSCTSICPMLIAQLQRIENALASDVRAQTRVLLVSLDPERDSVDRLAELARRHAIESERWHFTRAPEASVQEIAALLGVRYRRMPDGEISHSPLVALLDRDGLLLARVEGTLDDASEITSELTRMVQRHEPDTVDGPTPR
jgi:protein SCO1/2